MYRSAPMTKYYLFQNIYSAKVEKPISSLESKNILGDSTKKYFPLQRFKLKKLEPCGLNLIKIESHRSDRTKSSVINMNQKSELV